MSFMDTDSIPQTGRKRRRSSVTEKLGHIEAVCTLLETAYESNSSLELMLSKNSLWYITPKRRRIRVQENTTLHDILDRAKKLTAKDRRTLAVILANALLHLKGSHWLQDRWTKKDVCFMGVVPGSVDVSRPYLASRFPASTYTKAEDNLDHQLHQCPPLLALGIMLLELGVSKPIEVLRLREDLVDGKVCVNTDLTTAERVLKDSVDELHDGYRTAVQACLDCTFVPPEVPLDFDNEDFRNLVHKHIVRPLELELEYGWKIKPEDLWSDES